MLKKKEEGTGLRFHRVLCPWFGDHQERSVAVFFGRRISGHNMDDCTLCKFNCLSDVT